MTINTSSAPRVYRGQHERNPLNKVEEYYKMETHVGSCKECGSITYQQPCDVGKELFAKFRSAIFSQIVPTIMTAEQKIEPAGQALVPYVSPEEETKDDGTRGEEKPSGQDGIRKRLRDTFAERFGFWHFF